MLPAKGFRSVQLNCQSIGNKHQIVKQHVLQLKPEVFCMSETWLTPLMPDNMLEIPNYILERVDRTWIPPLKKQPSKGGGVGMYVKSDLDYSSYEFKHLNMSSKDIEIIWISFHPKNRRKYVIASVYRPPNGNVIAFCNMLKDMVTDITTDSNADIFITGDFNIDYNKHNHPKRQELKNWETSLGLKQYISYITRFSDSPSTIDLIFSNSDDISHSGVLHLNISDHEATYFVRKKITPKFKRVT